jgi:hypothetical protein
MYLIDDRLFNTEKIKNICEIAKEIKDKINE